MITPVRHRLPPLIALAAVAMCLWANAAQAEPSSAHQSTAALKKELTSVIDAQLAAFRANDYPKAYTFAAAPIREMFAPERFEQMVRAGFPLIANSARAEYGLAFDTGEEAVVNVTVESPAGSRTQYQYLLKKEGDAWKISGVSELKPEGLSV